MDHGTSAADRLARHREAERLRAQLREAEADVSSSRAQLTSAQLQLKTAAAELEMHLRGMAS